MNIKPKNPHKLGAIFGSGRSGTTWLGAIISSHPEISYRFEPFHRLEETNSEIRRVMDSIYSENFSSDSLSDIYNALSPAYPGCEKPPFFQKNFFIRKGRRFVWPLSRNNTIGAYIFQKMYTPKQKPMLIFKEVDRVDIMIELMKREIPIVYIVRHPCAVISSVIKGQQNSLMPEQRRSVLDSLLKKYQLSLAKEYQDSLNSLDLCQQEALLWLIDVERSLSACQKYSNALIVIYEQLTEYPRKISEKIFQHFGLQMTQQTIDFIEESTQKSSSSRIKRGEIGINSYFSVFKNPQNSRDRWKTTMSSEDRIKVMNIVRESQLITNFFAHGFWS